ncbi:unnamed protein product, partial [Rotaria magnacalcarata]
MIRRPLNEQNFQSNLIDIARQVTYLLGVKTEDALIELESNIQIEAISLFIQEFYNLTIDRMFPSRDEQIVLSDFIFALDYFLEQRLEYLLPLEIHDDEKRMKLNTLESEIKKLKICLNKKIYKENNYRLVEYEYENLIQTVSETPIVRSLHSSLSIVENLLYLINRFEEKIKKEFIEDFKTVLGSNNSSAHEDLLDIKKMKNIEQFLKSREKDLLKFVSINDQLSKIKIDKTMKNIIGSENDSIEINLRNLYILEIQLKTHLKQFERIQIEN